MSRAGTPTDNPVNESLNGWIKEELFIDFKQAASEGKNFNTLHKDDRKNLSKAISGFVDLGNCLSVPKAASN